MTENRIDLRVSNELNLRMELIASRCGATKSEIARKALRKWRRITGGRVEPLKNTTSSTYNGHSLKLVVPEHLHRGISGADLRRVLNLYVGHVERNLSPSSPLDLEPGYEGVDYIIKGTI